MSRGRAIAVAQTVPVPGDVEANLEQHIQLATLAADAGADLVLFPELSLTGYELGLAGDLAFAEHDPRLAPLLDAAAARSIVLVAGAPVNIAASLHIGAFIVSPDRTISIYTKHHLGAFSSSAAVDGVVPPAEATVFQPGTSNPLIDVRGRTAAIAVCADAGRPSHPRQAAERGARIYLAGMFIIPSEYDGDATKLRSYASQYSMVVAMANYGAATGGLAAAGRSAIWSDTGDPLVQLEAGGTGVAVATEHRNGWSGAAIVKC